MLRFDMRNGVAVIDAGTLLMIPEMGNLYKTIKDPVLRDRVFTYIHIVARVDSTAPFFGANKSELSELARRQYFSDAVPYPEAIEESIQSALKAYTDAFETANVRILKVFDDKIDQLKTLIEDITPKIMENTNPTSGAITFSSNVELITKTLEKIDGLLTTKERLEAKIRNESEGKGSVRGNKKPSRLERKTLLRQTND